MIENTNTKQFYPGPILNNTLEITDFLFNDAEQIKIKHSKLNEEGILIDVDLNYPTDYEVTKVLPSDVNAAEAALTASTGQVMLKNVNVAAGEKLTVYRVSQIIQDKDYPRTGAFPAATHEGALDYLTMQNQEQKDELDRALKVPVSTEGFSGNLPVPIPSRALKINNDGTGFEMSEFDPDLALITTEEFKNQAQQAAIDALSSQTAAANSETVATQQSQNATTQAANAKASADNAAELNQQLTNNFNTYSSSLQGDFSTYTSNLISTKEDGMASLANASNALRQTQITNCLLEIPQDIKLELNNGVLTLKAGSKVIVPNGSGVFTEKVITSDISKELNNANLMAFENGGGGFDFMLQNYCFSGTTAPTSFQDGLYAVWYDTANNIVKRTGDAGATWTTGYSLPLFTADVNNNLQVFNGFGYIGSTVFVTKGVKGLIPNGRNEDGTLKNIELTTTKVQINTIDDNWTSQDWFIRSNGWLDWYPLQHGQIVYNEETNTWINNWQGGINFWFPVGKTHSTGGKITSFTPKLPFRAVDYSDKSEVSSWAMPSSKYINLTVGASGTTYTAPTNGLFCAYCFMSTTNAFLDMNVGGIYNVRIKDANWNSSDIAQIIPAKKGSVLTLQYSGVNFYSFRFIYAEGEV